MTDEERLKRRKELEQDDVKKILGTPEGLRFFWRLLEIAGIYRTTFTGNSNSFFNEGRRSVGLEIKADLMAVDLDNEGRMAREHARWMTNNDLIPRGGDHPGKRNH